MHKPRCLSNIAWRLRWLEVVTVDILVAVMPLAHSLTKKTGCLAPFQSLLQVALDGFTNSQSAKPQAPSPFVT